LPTTRSYYEESLALRRQAGEAMSLANVVRNLAEVAWDQDDVPTTVALLEEYRAMALASGLCAPWERQPSSWAVSRRISETW
jgi:hypothetical protein